MKFETVIRVLRLGSRRAPKRDGQVKNRLLGVAIVIAGLFVGVATAPVELDYISYTKASGYRESVLLDASASRSEGKSAATRDGDSPAVNQEVSAPDHSTSLSQASSADEEAGNGAYILTAAAKTYDFSTGYYQSSIYSDYFNIPSNIKTSMTYGGSSEELLDFISFGVGDDESSKVAAKRPLPGKDSTLKMPSRTTNPNSKSVLGHEPGCGRCAPKELASPLQKTPARRNRASAEIKRERQSRLLAAKTFPLNLFSPSL